MSCSELGQDQSKLKSSLSLSPPLTQHSFLVLLGGETETPTASDSTPTTATPECFPSSLNTLLPSVCRDPKKPAVACNTDQPQH